MRNAPPTLPGMPSRNSTPLKPFRFASTATSFQFCARAAAQPFAINFNPAEIRRGQGKSPRRENRRRARADSSRAQSRKTAGCARRKISRRTPNLLPTPARHNMSAGPPTRSVVCFASGSLRRMTVARETRPASSSAMFAPVLIGFQNRSASCAWCNHRLCGLAGRNRRNILTPVPVDAQWQPK